MKKSHPNIDDVIRYYKSYFKDYCSQYNENVTFSKNMELARHRWYNFKEGFSSQLVKDFVAELEDKPNVCLDPFSGSGSTALTCQELGIKCYSIEINPFLHTLGMVKLCTDYRTDKFDEYLDFINKSYNSSSDSDLDIPKMKTITENGKLKKWLFHKKTLTELLKIRKSISKIEDSVYKDLFRIVFSSILIEFSNVYKNGKCHAYKDNWKALTSNYLEVITRFNERAEIFRRDISNTLYEIDNSKYCLKADVRKCIDRLEEKTIDLVITSPPYLNSRDYTDSYMIELWMLGFIKNYEELLDLRRETIKSHVQVVWKSEDTKNTIVKHIVESLRGENLWNKGIPNMIIGYFADMDEILKKVYGKMKSGSKMFLNVANSAYYGKEIPTDVILAKICEDIGFKLEEIRIARFLKTSWQQINGANGDMRGMRESVIVLRKG